MVAVGASNRLAGGGEFFIEGLDRFIQLAENRLCGFRARRVLDNDLDPVAELLDRSRRQSAGVDSAGTTAKEIPVHERPEHVSPPAPQFRKPALADRAASTGIAK